MTNPSNLLQNFGQAELSTKLQIGGVILFLASYAMISSFLQHKRYPIHRGAVAVVIGVVTGLIVRLSSPSAYNQLTKLNQTIIFLILLPAILFAKGYTFKKGAFIKSLKFIILFGVIGTFLSYLITTSLIYAANQLNLVKDAKDINNYRTLSLWQVILLSACLCSIDTVASQQQVQQNRYSKLNSIIVGQDTLKDCVTIVLFRSILRLQQMESPTKFIFYWYTPLKILLNFCIMIIGSSILSVALGIGTAYLFKKLRFLSNDKGITQTTVLFLLGFMTYICAQCMALSGIVSILVYGVVLNRYNYFNLSTTGQVSSKNTFLFVSNICEGLLFLIMGMMVWQIQWQQQQPTNPITHSYVFCLVVFAILIVGRLFNIYVLGLLARLYNKQQFNLNKDELFIIFVSGIVRGATPFALFTSVQIVNQSSKYAKNEGLVLKTTIIIIVMFGTLVLNSIIPWMFRKPLRRLRDLAKKQIQLKINKISVKQHNQSNPKSIQNAQSSQQQQIHNKYHKLAKSHFRTLEQRKLKPLLIYDYHTRKQEINKIKLAIKQQQLRQALKQLQQQQKQEQQRQYEKHAKNSQSLLSN